MGTFEQVGAALRKETVYGSLVGILALTGIPYIQFGIIYKKYWCPNKSPVSTGDCTCACWDTIFKGAYEKQPGSYKHVYFNITLNTLCIWLVTVVAVIGFYESLKYIYGLLSSANLRWPMFALYVSSIYPHYYSWWMYFNLFNDDFYKQFCHQTLFTATELVATGVVLHMCKASNETRVRYILVIISVALAHLLAGFTDNFIINVLYRRGETYQKARDYGMVFSDVLSVAVALSELIKHSKQYPDQNEKICSRRNVMGCAGFVITFWLITAIC